MRHLMGLLLVLGAVYVGMQLYSKYQTIRDQDAESRGASSQSSGATEGELAGMPASLEASLEAARRQGAAGLGAWLGQNRSYVRDPRLASIELDYVLLLSQRDPKEARRLFKSVQSRVPESSPVYPRIKRLEKTYQ